MRLAGLRSSDVQQDTTQKLNHMKTGSATLSFVSTVHDPLREIPVHGVQLAAYSKSSLFAKAHVVSSVDRDAFLPYSFAAYDNWVSLLDQ